jgi:hypothetical protein
LPRPEGDEFAKSIFYERRFVDILACFHLVDNSAVSDAEKKADSFWQVRPLIVLLNKEFAAHYYPKQNLSVDEITTPAKHRHRAKNYNKDKPNKWGFKSFASAESCSGYVLQFIPYQGKDQARPEDQGLGFWAVNSTINPEYNDAGHIVTMDNYFMSAKLLRHLLTRGVHGIGTTRSGRKGQPSSALLQWPQKTDRGTVKQFVSADRKVFATVWRDSKDVRMLSTFSCPRGTKVRKIKAKGNAPFRLQNITVPLEIHHYNGHMNGVDKNDQRTSYFRPTIRTRRATRNYLFHCFQLAAVNTHIIYNQTRYG